MHYEVRHKEVIDSQCSGGGGGSGVLEDLSRFVAGRPGQCGIVYCHRRADCESVCAALCARGVSAEAYHAGLKADERSRVLQRWCVPPAFLSRADFSRTLR